MPKNLQTKFMRIGRSGATVDGRTIEADHLRKMAENYDPDLFKALIWPEHKRWFNMGGVAELKAEANDEGGVDLYAVIEPNQEYLYAIRTGQSLFTSMEIMPNFRDTGEVYLTGLAATDNPASVATEQMHFSTEKKEELHAAFIEHEEIITPETPSFFKRLADKFNHQSPSEKENDMKKEESETLRKEFAALKNQMEDLSKKFSSEKPPTEDEADALEAFSSRLAAVESFMKKGDEDNTGITAEEFAAVQNAVVAITAKFESAMQEQPGTQTPESDGNDGDHFKAEDHY